MLDNLYWIGFVAVAYALFMLPRVIWRLIKGQWPDAYWGKEAKEMDLRDW